MLISFSKHKLKPNGEVVLTTRYKDQVEDVQFFVVPGVQSVLSGHTSIKLDLLKRVNQLTSKKPGTRVELDDFPELFTGLGCMPGTYHTALAEGAIPVVHPSRTERSSSSSSNSRSNTTAVTIAATASALSSATTTVTATHTTPAAAISAA